jgi:TRAP-type C4-dicarboxylate transport system substrate-binding protein
MHSQLQFLQLPGKLSLRLPAAVALILSGALGVQAAPAKESKVIRWVVAHDRGTGPFFELNQDFARRLEKKSDGKLKVEFIKTDVPESRLDEAAYKQVAEGSAEMSQLSAAGAKVRVFDMPFVFRSYEHAEAVFASAVGEGLVAGISSSSEGKVRGLGFTYSGGLRILVGKVALNSAADFKGLKMRSGTSDLVPFVRELGVKLVDAGAASREKPIAGLASGAVDLEETEINRLAIVAQDNPELLKQIAFANLTYHRMYVTAIVANEKFLASLAPAQRKLLISEMERKLSVDMAARNLALLSKKGLRFVQFPKSELQALVKAGDAVQNQHPELAKIIQEIRAVKEPTKVAHN